MGTSSNIRFSVNSGIEEVYHIENNLGILSVDKVMFFALYFPYG
jgi:hypothetical protein